MQRPASRADRAHPCLWFALGLLPRAHAAPDDAAALQPVPAADVSKWNDEDRFDCAPQPVKYHACPRNLTTVHERKLDKPIRWLHVPKTGESFVNILVPLACPQGKDGLPSWAAVHFTDEFLAKKEWPGGDHSKWFRYCMRDIVSVCKRLEDWSWKTLMNHIPLEAGEVDKYDLFTMMRDPVGRLISAYEHEEQRKAECHHCDPDATLEDFAAAHLKPGGGGRGPAGCATKMLIGKNCGDEYPSWKEVEQAKTRLRKFTYVGLTDEWTDSVCTMNGMFGRKTTEAMLGNTRPGHYAAGGGGGGAQKVARKDASAGAEADKTARDMEAEKMATDLAAAAKKGGFFDWADHAIFELARNMSRWPLQSR